MLVQKGAPSARRAVHMIFEGEKVRPDTLSQRPRSASVPSFEGSR